MRASTRSGTASPSRRREGHTLVDFLTGTLSLCIGSAVAWLVALYTEHGARLLIWNTAFGVVGAALCAFVIGWTAPAFTVVGLLVAGPLCSLLAIQAGNAARRAFRAR
jgi:hypothetical protein